MRELLGSLLGVPAAILIAGGMGIAAVTLISRVYRADGRRPIRWAHLVLGLGLCGAGVLLLDLDISIVGLH